jgi:lambda family phage portal protein
MNVLDQLISVVAPRAAVRRQAARLQLDQLRRYDADGRGRRVENWLTQNTSADAANGRGFTTKRDRARDLVRNNPYAQRIIKLWESALIGQGWSFKAKAGRRNGGARGQRATDEFRAWAIDPRQCDFDGLASFDGLMAKVVRCWKESGEVLIRMRIPTSAKMTRLGLRIPLQLQVLEPDWIAETQDGLNSAGTPDGGWTHRGIEYDREGTRINYWLYNHHPGEPTIRTISPEANRVPAEEIIHLFSADRPQQTRGVTCLAPVVITLRDLDDYMDAQLLKQKVSACMMGVIVDVDGAGDQKANVTDRMEPGAMARLGPGQDIRFSSPPSVGEIDQIMRTYLLRTAMGANVPYELLTGDFQGTNFSAGRLGWQSFNKQTVCEQWQLLAPVAFNRVWGWWARQASIAGVPTDGLTADWTPPPPQAYDPAADTKAIIQKMRAGLLPPQEAIRMEGLEPEDVIALYVEWNRLLDAGEVVLDTDPRKVSAAGLTQARPIGSELPPAGEPPGEATPPPQVTPAVSP